MRDEDKTKEQLIRDLLELREENAALRREAPAGKSREDEERIKLALAASRMGVWEWDFRTGAVFWSPECYRILRVKHLDKTFAGLAGIVHPEDAPRLMASISRTMRDGSVYSEEVRFLLDSDEVRWVFIQGQIQHAPDGGEPVRLIGTIRDITERKQTEETLQRYQLLAEHSRDIILFIRKKDGRILEANKAAIEAYGFGREELLERTVHDLRAPMERDVTSEQIDHADAGGTLFETIHQRADGSIFPVEVSSRGASIGGVRTLVSMVRDITERKRIETALEKRLVALTQPFDETESLEFEELFNLDEIQKLQDQFAKAAGVASIITHVDGTPITHPSNFCRLCETIIRGTEEGRKNCYYSDSVIGRHNPTGPVVQPCLSGGLWDAGASITVGGRHIANWLIGQVRDETQRDDRMRAYARNIGADEESFMAAYREVPSMSRERFEEIAQALFTLAGQLSSMAYQNIQQARFITERKAIEDTLRRAHDELELRVQERTAEIQRANAELLSYASRLELVNRELQEFAFVASHDLAEPLRKIQAFGDRLRSKCQEPLGDEGCDYLKRMESAAKRMQSLLSALLSYSRVAGRVTPFKRVDLTRAAKEAITDLELSIERVGAKVEIEELPAIDAFPAQMRQLFQNLVGNALKYCRDGEKPHIQIQGSVGNNICRILVRDNGIGFDEQYLNVIFKPFQRLHGRSEYEGTGMGLAICRKIVERHGGSITARSAPGEGSTFIITLPTRQSDPVKVGRDKPAPTIP
ncbi:MAG: PocR ligand-binding domain-containing protein [Acidobacteriota bacterium]